MKGFKVQTFDGPQNTSVPIPECFKSRLDECGISLDNQLACVLLSPPQTMVERLFQGLNAPFRKATFDGPSTLSKNVREVSVYDNDLQEWKSNIGNCQLHVGVDKLTKTRRCVVTGRASFVISCRTTLLKTNQVSQDNSCVCWNKHEPQMVIEFYNEADMAEFIDISKASR